MRKMGFKNLTVYFLIISMLFAVVSPANSVFYASNGDYKLINFDSPAISNIRIFPVDSKTSLSYDYSRNAARITCENTASRTPAVHIGTVTNGTFGYGLGEDISVKEYPVIAVRIRLSNPELCFNNGSGTASGRFDWTTDTYVASGTATPWRDMSSKTTLRKTDDWQTVYINTTTLTAYNDTRWLVGNWAGLRLLFDGDTAEISDSVDIKWIGFFKTVAQISMEENKEPVLGDANSDYSFNAADLVRMKKHIALVTSQINFDNSDIDDSQSLNIKDLVYMRDILLGKSYDDIYRELNCYENSADVNFPVSNGMTAEESSAKINNKTESPIMKLNSKSVAISEFDAAWSYTHHGYITAFKGKIYAMWSNGRVHEDDLGQRVMYSYSSDFENWSTPVPLEDTVMGEKSECYLTPMGFFVEGDTLIAYYRAAEYKYDILENDYTMRPTSGGGNASSKTYFKTSEDGVNWTDALPISLYNAGVSQSRRNRFGRWIWSGSTGIMYSDNTNGISGWHSSSVPDSHITDALSNGAVQLCEANWYQTEDYVIHLLMRSNSGYLWHSESYDNGESWSGVYPTDFTDDNTMCYFGTLPDGRYYYIGSPLFSGSNNRAPLMMCISEDGYNFSEQYIICDEDYHLQQNGYAKGGTYGYPECVIYDGYLYMIYSLGKEIMQVTRINLDDIGNKETMTLPDRDNQPVLEIDFTDSASLSLINAEQGTVISYDDTEKALKVEQGSEANPAMIYGNGLWSKGINTEKYPVIALRIRKENYKKLDFGSCFFSTTESILSNKRWVHFKSPKYCYSAYESDEYITVAVDLSKMNNYYDYTKYPDNLSLFGGYWDGIKIGFAKSGLAEDNSTFYIKSVGLFENFWDAYAYYD